MEEIFKAGFACGICSSDGKEANDVFEEWRYAQLTAVSGKEVADEWLKTRHSTDKKPEGLKCPDCGSEMIERKSQYGMFWGCRQYPKCKGTRDSEGLSKADRRNEREMMQGKFLEPVANESDSFPTSGTTYGSGFSFKKG